MSERDKIHERMDDLDVLMKDTEYTPEWGIHCATRNGLQEALNILEGLEWDPEEEAWVRPFGAPVEPVPPNTKWRCCCGVMNREGTTRDFAAGEDHVWRHRQGTCERICDTEFQVNDNLFRCTQSYGHDAVCGSSDEPFASAPVPAPSFGSKNGGESWEGNGPCMDCHRASPFWHAPNDVWQAVMDREGNFDHADPPGVICPTCFVIRAWRKDLFIEPRVWWTWEPIPEGFLPTGDFAWAIEQRNIAQAEIEKLRSAPVPAPTLDSVQTILREFKAEGTYEFKAETAPEAFLQQEIKSLLADLDEALSAPVPAPPKPFEILTEVRRAQPNAPDYEFVVTRMEVINGRWFAWDGKDRLFVADLCTPVAPPVGTQPTKGN